IWREGLLLGLRRSRLLGILAVDGPNDRLWALYDGCLRLRLHLRHGRRRAEPRRRRERHGDRESEKDGKWEGEANHRHWLQAGCGGGQRTQASGRNYDRERAK